MKEKIDLIFSDLKNEVITEKEAHNKVLLLFDVIKSVCKEEKCDCGREMILAYKCYHCDER